jgi:hypothetical protein
VLSTNKILASAFCALVSVAAAQTNPSSTTVDVSAQHDRTSAIVSELTLRGTVPTMFATLVTEASVSGGVATVNPDCSRGPESFISLPGGTSFEAALRQLAEGRSMSESPLKDGLANLFPSSGVPILLRIRINRFEWYSTTPVRETVARLSHLPDVSEKALRLGFTEAPFEGSASTICFRGECIAKQEPAPVLERSEGATLLAVLNRVVQAHPRSVWSYSEYRCDEKTLFSLDILAE